MADGPSSHPPSEPRPEKRSVREGVAYDRPARLQMIVALVLGLVLVAIPLYLWRRPRVESAVVVSDADGGPAAALAADAAADDASAPLALSDPKVLECHDPGPGSTAPEKCDHLVDFEKAFARAIQDAAKCTSSPGTVPYVADVSFARKKQPIHLTMNKDSRTLAAKSATGCTAAVKKNLGAVNLDGMKHEHARYKIAVTATYPSR
jgi:hypothetical protein